MNLAPQWPNATPFLRGSFWAWVGSMVALPLAYFAASETVMLTVLSLSVLLQALTVWLIVGQAWGARRALITALGVGLASGGIEFIGSTTGYPFGVYHYTPKLQPQLAGVPLIIPLAWLMMLPCAWAVAQTLNGGSRGLPFMLLSGFTMTTWDLFLDPQMVAWGLWAWAYPQGYFGIPWSNYLGWWLSATVLTALAQPRPLPPDLLLIMITLVWLLETLGLSLFWGQPGPAFVGFMSLGTVLGLAWRAHRLP